MISRAALEEDKFAYAERELATTDQGRQGVTEFERFGNTCSTPADESRIALDRAWCAESTTTPARYSKRSIWRMALVPSPADRRIFRRAGRRRSVSRRSGRISSATQILVRGTLPKSLRLATRLRAGFKVEMYLSTGRLPNQLRYANRKGIPFCTDSWSR